MKDMKYWVQATFSRLCVAVEPSS